MKILLFVTVYLYASLCMAQQTPLIQFDGLGKLKSPLPEKLYTNDKLKFKVTDHKESFDDYAKIFTDRLKQSKILLEKLKAEEEKMDVLKKVFDIDTMDLKNVIADLNRVIDSPLLTATPRYVPKFVAADKKYFNIKIDNVTPSVAEDMEPNYESSALAIKTTELQIRFTLTQKDVLKKLIINWLNKTKGDYSGTLDLSPLAKLKEEITVKAKEIRKFAADVQPVVAKFKAAKKKGQNVNAMIRKYAPVIINYIEQTNRFMADVKALSARADSAVDRRSKKAWMLEWLWFQSAALPAVNPFGFSENIGNAPDDSELGSLKIKVQVREAFLKANINKLKPGQVDSVLHFIDSLKQSIADIEQSVAQFKEKKTANDQAPLAFRTTAQELNKGIFYVSNNTKDIIYWMRHHNVAENSQLMNEDEIDEYLEADRVIILSHNLKINETAQLTLKFEDIKNDAPQLTEGLEPVIKLLETSLLKTGSPLLQSLDQLMSDLDDSLNTLITDLETLKTYDKSIDYLLQQSEPMLNTEEITDKSAGFHSEVTNPVKTIQGPRKATYVLKTVSTDKSAAVAANASEKTPDTFSYRINKLYRIFPMAGLAWTLTRFNNVVKDTTGGDSQFRSEQEQHVKFMLGVKVYFKKTDIRNSKIFYRNDQYGKQLWLSRTSLTLAFDARKPLNNIYTGLGLDIWPGFCFNVGCVFNKYSYKLYKNGQAFENKTPYRAGAYLGLSTDLSLFAELGKFLNF